MSKSSFDKWFVTLALLIVMGGVVFHFVKSDRKVQSQKQKQPGAQSDFSESYDFHPYYSPSVPRPSNGVPEQAARIAKLPREKVEAWLAKHSRDAVSLLAAFRALDDTNYLNEAATNFPNNPQVELAVLARDEFPADRRKWLDLFKVSSPSNSLANYLSAEDCFKNGNTVAAVQELQAATGKSQFDNYTVASELTGEELAQFCGESPLQAYQTAISGVATEELPELATFKRLAQGIEQLQTQEMTAGDNTSAQNLAQMGMVLGNQLINGGGSGLLINQLLGIAVERIVLSQLDSNTGYDFLDGKTPNQVSQELGEQKKEMTQTYQSFNAVYPNLTEAEMLNYLDRKKTYGEMNAMRWVVQQHPPGNP